MIFSGLSILFCSIIWDIYIDTEKEYHEELDKLLDVLGVNTPFNLVIQVGDELVRNTKKRFVESQIYSQADMLMLYDMKIDCLAMYICSYRTALLTFIQFFLKGFLVGSYGLTWALKNQSRISKISILNSPLTVSSPVPGLFQQLRFNMMILTIALKFHIATSSCLTHFLGYFATKAKS